jgi:hypothetical protein
MGPTSRVAEERIMNVRYYHAARRIGEGDPDTRCQRHLQVRDVRVQPRGHLLSVGFLFNYAAKETLFDQSGTMPAGLVKAFHGSFFASVPPGDNAAWVILGAMEALIVILLAVSPLSGEFLPARPNPVLLAGLGFATARQASADGSVRPARCACRSGVRVARHGQGRAAPHLPAAFR